MGEPVELDNDEWWATIDKAVAVVEAVRSDWPAPVVTEHEVFCMSRVLDLIHARRVQFLDAVAIVAGAADQPGQVPGVRARAQDALDAMQLLLRPPRPPG